MSPEDKQKRKHEEMKEQSSPEIAEYEAKTGLTGTTTAGMFETLPKVAQLDGSLSSVPPDNLACAFEAFFIVCEDDEVLEGGDGTPGSELEVGRGTGDRGTCLSVCGHGGLD